MKNLNERVIEACVELVARQYEIVPHLAAALGVETNEVFYQWAFRRTAQIGTFLDNGWRYFFHGMECDLENLSDGRFLRIDFGPRGAIDTFTGYGVLQFIMTAKPPWREFKELKTYFAKGTPPYNKLSGDYSKFSKVWDELFEIGAFEVADQDLIEFEEKFTTIREDGSRYIKFPPETPERKIFDCLTARRQRLSGSYKIRTIFE